MIRPYNARIKYRTVKAGSSYRVEDLGSLSRREFEEKNQKMNE